MTLHLLCGIPGSGKSTLGGKLSGYIVSTDSIRKFLWNDESITSHDRLVFELAESIMDYLLCHKKNVIFDATNLTVSRRKRCINLAKNRRAKVVLHWVNCPLDTAIERNFNRERQVPVRAIKALKKSFQPPKIQEGLDLIKIYGPKLNLFKLVTPKFVLTRFPQH